MMTNGRIIDERYLILEKIGSGGFGAVYLAEDTRFGGNNRVAIKQITQTDERIAKSFRREADLLFNLSHPNLPKVTNCFQQGDANFIVMDYISGDDLAQSLLKGKRFSVEEVLRIADAVLDALEYLHSNAIFHRDIKPHNIKVDASGRVFLLDFGTAKGSLDAKTLTLAGQSITGYTPFYAPLEQVLRVDANSYLLLQSLGSEQFEKFTEKKTDARSDIYSFGATLYHLLTGHSPERATATIRAHALWSGKNDPLPSIQSLSAEVPQPLAQSVHRALELEPENRFQTAAQFREALKNSLQENNFSAATIVIADDEFISAATVPAAAVIKKEEQPSQNPGRQVIPIISEPDAGVESQLNFSDIQPEKTAPPSNYLKYAAAAAAVFLILLLGGLAAALMLWKNPTGEAASTVETKKEPARQMNYSLLVQKMRDGKRYQEPFESSGQEVFESGYQFQMRLTPPDDGYLYIFAEGVNERQENVFNIIFPTPQRNSGLAGVSPAQRYETGWNEFGGKTGTENFWVVWSRTPPEIAEKSRENAFQNNGRISDKALTTELKNYLTSEQNKKADIAKDAEKKLTSVGFAGDSIVYLMQLEHR